MKWSFCSISVFNHGYLTFKVICDMETAKGITFSLKTSLPTCIFMKR